MIKFKILDGDYNVIKKNLSVQEAATYMDTKEITIYQYSARAATLNGYIIARQGVSEVENMLTYMEIGDVYKYKSADEVHKILSSALTRIKGIK